MKKGYVQVYTGDGKGKTTAAMGLAMRSIAAGFDVYVGQFMKQGYTGEQKVFDSLSSESVGRITFEQYGTGAELKDYDKELDRQAAQAGFLRAREILVSGDFDVVILDEINVAVSLGYVSVDEIVEAIQLKPVHTELVLTGRSAADEVIAMADLVTEMQSVKHYFDQGVMARRGIEM